MLMRVFAVLSALLFTSCGSQSVSCFDNGNCPEGQACLAEVCMDVECLSSSECGLQQFCNTAHYTCDAGCEINADCMAGETCKEGVCESYGCRDTQLDCFIGEICNLSTGICEQAEGQHCESCSGISCEEGAACFTFEVGAVNGYCQVECSSDDECPRGYDCGPYEGTNYCFGACPLYDALGYLL